MKKFVAGIVTLSVILTFLAVSSSAQTATSSLTRKDLVQQRVEDRKEKMASREAALKAKLQSFRDKKKAEIVERIDQNLDKINKHKTEMMMTNLNRMSDLLTRIESNMNSQSEGKDITKAKESIEKAKIAIANAKVAVTTQSEKDYTVTVTSESKVKTDAQTVRETLKNDLKLVHDLIVEARKALSEAISVTRSTLKGTNGQ